VKSFRSFITEALSVKDFPDEVLSDFDVEVSKKSSSRTTVFLIKSTDRDTDRDELGKNLKDAGIKFGVVGSSLSSFDPIEIKSFNGQRVIFLFKPKSGGMNETTLNASITELFPAIAHEKKYKPKSVAKFYDFILKQDVEKLKCVQSSDVEAAKKFIGLAEDSSKFQDKMENAIGVYKYIKDEEKEQPIKQVYWGYRAKPKGVPSGHPGDIFIEFKGKKPNILGVSLKAGGKKTSEPKLNTYVNPIYSAFGEEKAVTRLRTKLHKDVYSLIKGMPDAKSYDGKGKDRKKTEDLLRDLDKKNNRKYEQLYDKHLEIVRDDLIKLFNKHGKVGGKTFDYIKEAVLRDAPDVPTKVVKAVGATYEQVTDDDELGVFLPVVKFLKAEKSKSSKQNWFIHLKSNDTQITMQMSVRTNKAGHAGKKKLGQFFNLSVKYNGLLKK